MLAARRLCDDKRYEKGSICIRADIRNFNWTVSAPTDAHG